MLPAKYKNSLIEIRSIYRPYNYVSGDFFDFQWHNKHVLHGYIFDIMGHGLATAFNMSAIRVLLAQAFALPVPLNEKLAWFNQQAIPFLEDGSFVAVLGFSFDFHTKQLTYSMAGINQFLVVSQKQPSVIQAPGIFAGLDKNAVYEQHTMSFFSGDIFYFMTDGLFELLPDPMEYCPSGGTASYHWLCKAMRSPARRDDISALCLYIK
jgi:serine phosphatase RsbU (regulator of sigma subunit)